MVFACRKLPATMFLLAMIALVSTGGEAQGEPSVTSASATAGATASSSVMNPTSSPGAAASPTPPSASSEALSTSSDASAFKKECLGLGTPCAYKEGYGTELCCQPDPANDRICGCATAPLTTCALKENVCCISGTKCGCSKDEECCAESVCMKDTSCCS